MIKVITLLHRRPGMTREEFIEYYESNHRLIGEKYLKPYASRYVRRFCRPATADVLKPAEPPCDVVMEIWFPDQAAFDGAMADLSTPEAQAEIVADEEKLFDREKMVSFVVDEYESDLT